jgi:hypothetical protein
MKTSFPIIPPGRLFSRAEVLIRPSPVPAVNGLYAWYFRDVPVVVPTNGCLTFDGKTLLYLGIAPDRANKPNSRASLLSRIRYHYRGKCRGLDAPQNAWRTAGRAERISLAARRQWKADNANPCWLRGVIPGKQDY